jgi:hypothetical protein
MRKVKETMLKAKSSMRKKYKPKLFLRKKLYWRMHPEMMKIITESVFHVKRVMNQLTQYALSCKHTEGEELDENKRKEGKGRRKKGILVLLGP